MHGAHDASSNYRLRAFIGFSQEHYKAYRLLADGTWVLQDDTTLFVLGSWEDLVANCVGGHTQPTTAFYEVCFYPELRLGIWHHSHALQYSYGLASKQWAKLNQNPNHDAYGSICYFPGKSLPMGCL